MDPTRIQRLGCAVGAADAVPDEPVVQLVTFATDKIVEGKERSAAWSDVCRILREPKEYPNKNSLPLIKFGMLPQGSRRAGNLPTVLTAAVGDYDGGEVTVAQALERLNSAGIIAAIYTTRRHTSEKPRWRVVAPFSRPVEPDQYEAMVGYLNGILGGILAPESWENSRCYYYGKVGGVDYHFRHAEGDLCLDIKVLFADWEPIGKPASAGRTKRPETAPTVECESFDLERELALQRVTDETIDHLRSALGINPATGTPWIDASDYNTCIAVGEALKSLAEVGRDEEARGLWLDWLALDTSFFDGEQDMAAKWDGFNASRTDYQAVFAKAGRGGWPNPWEKPKAPTAAEVIEKLRKLSPEEVLGTWLADAVLLGKGAAHEIVEEVSRLSGKGRRPLNADLAEARTKAAQESRQEQMRQRAGKRLLIHYHPEDRTKHAGEVEAAIIKGAKPGEYIAFGGLLSHVALKPLPYTHLIDNEDGEAPPVPQIEPLGKVAVLGKVERVTTFYEMREGGPAIIAVPDKIVDILIEKPEHKAPPVSGLVTHPIVLRTGEILAGDGLHLGTGLFLSGAAVPGVEPYGPREAAVAMNRLRAEFLEGFEFATELDADVAVAGLITGVQRRVLDMAPGLGILASTQASGKTTLARRIHVLLTGRDMPVSTFPQGDEAEVQKRLLSLLLRSPAMVCFDNITDGTTFRSGAIAAAMTGPSIEQRVLGLSRDANCLTNVLFVITGNNLALGPDEVSRWMIARLAPSSARPEERTFKHPDVVMHATRMRASVLRDVVGIVAGYLVSGEGLAPCSRFARWDRMVRQPMLWAGASDVAEVFKRNAESAEHVLAHESLLTALNVVFGDAEFLAAEVVAIIKEGKDEFGRSLVAKYMDRLTSKEAEAVVLRLSAALENLRVRDVRSVKSVGRGLASQLERVGFIGPEDERVAARLFARPLGGERYYSIRRAAS